MLTLDTLDRISLTPRPVGQMVVGYVARANYRFPLTRTRITVEGLDKIPRNGRIYIAMNHPDRYNYWPFQVQLWKQREQFTATWVKGKYFNNSVLEFFMVATANIPAPSKGYILTVDCVDVLGRPPSTELYRVLRRALDTDAEFEEIREWAREADVLADFMALQKTPRDMLGLRYDPGHLEDFVQAQRRLFSEMMARFVALNHQAFDRNLLIMVMPEGTRSIRLGTGRPGLAQMALRTKATIIPVGCNYSDLAYPGNSPFSRGGDIVYRVGDPLTPEAELAQFQIDEPYRPFTTEADRFAEQFAGVTDLMMERLTGLLDDRHLPSDDSRPLREGVRRFV